MKAIDFCPWDGGIKLYFRILTNSDFGCDFNMGYPFVMQMFSGEWQEAAEIYRRWFEENKAEGFVPISQNDKIPEWYSQSPIVVTYPVRGEHDMDVMEPNKMFPYINGLKHIDYLAQRLNSKIMVLLMHWEGTAPWAPPYVWPPYGGEEELEKYIDALHKEGHLIGLYCSGLGWTTQSHLVKEYNMTEEFRKRDLGKYMCVSPEQELLYSKTCTGIRESYDMCPTEKLCTDTMAEQAKYMIDADIDYIQLLDQNHGGAAYCCYSQNHSHPPVPGKWMTDAVNSIMDKIRSESAKKVLFGCESAAAESFIPNLLFNDNRFNLAYQIGVPVPAYAYIYHEYINNFMGNQVGINWVFDYEKNPENFAMRIAYSFCAGDMLTLVLNEDGKINWNWGKQQLDYLPDNDKIIEFVRIANKFRRDIAPQYLHLGKMIAPLATEVEKYEVTEFNGFTLTLEKVCFSRWQAKDGTWAQFFANYNDEDIDVGVNPKEKCILISEEGGIEFSGASMTIPKNSIVMLSNNLGYEKN